MQAVQAIQARDDSTEHSGGDYVEGDILFRQPNGAGPPSSVALRTERQDAAGGRPELQGRLEPRPEGQLETIHPPVERQVAGDSGRKHADHAGGKPRDCVPRREDIIQSGSCRVRWGDDRGFVGVAGVAGCEMSRVGR